MNPAINRLSLRLLVVTALIAAALITVGHRSTVHAADYGVEIVEPIINPQSWGYGANPIVVQVGDTVSWVNTGVAPHTVTAYDGSFDSGIMVSGAVWSFTASSPGQYGYYCTLHPDMVSTLIVEG